MATTFSSKAAFCCPSSPTKSERPAHPSFRRVPCQAVGLVRAQTESTNDAADRRSSTSIAANHGKLRLFLDSADKDVWKTWLPTGIFHGVTTNPLLLERADVSCQLRPLKKLTHTALSLGAKEVQLQTWGANAQDLYKMGSQLAEIDTAVVVKIPITGIGLTAASKLTAAGARVTMTGLYSTHQVLLAAGVGAEYAAPYLGRMILKGKDAVQDIQDMQRLLTGVSSQLRILVESIKTVDQILALALRGISSYALPSTLLGELVVDRDTEEASRDFEQAAARNQPRLFL